MSEEGKTTPAYLGNPVGGTGARFFRDPEAWDALQKLVVDPLVEHSDPSEQIRVWIPGCATGEDAYTVAILFREEFELRGVQRNLIIFASDVDESALAVARKGLYPNTIRADVAEYRLVRFFRAQGKDYRVASAIRDSIVFAKHNLLRDSPFLRQNLICCRNLLTYFDRSLQARAMALLRHACQDGAFMFLGPAEAADEELFHPLDKTYRIFEARSAEDMPSANEPLLRAIGRGYRATAVTEDSIEDLQCFNEELQSVNQELKSKLKEVSSAYTDLENLMAATNVATLFVDRDCRVARYTPRLCQIFNITARELHQPVRGLVHILDYAGIEKDARAVLAGEPPVEREIRSRAGHVFVMRVSPYQRFAGAETEGVVITFVDVSAIKRAQPATREDESRLETELEMMQALHRTTIKVTAAATMQSEIDQMLEAAMTLSGADFGNVQALEDDSKSLKLIASRGFEPNIRERFGSVSADEKICERAVRMRRTVCVEDVNNAALSAGYRELAARIGFSAVQAEPMIRKSGRLVGVFSMLFRAPRVFSERDLQLGEVVARQAAELID